MTFVCAETILDKMDVETPAKMGQKGEYLELREVLTDTLLDGVRMLPFLLAAYLLIEYLEHKAGDKLSAMLAGTGKYGSVGGALLGALPQCGFSVAAANFYAGGVITRGALIAVFLATSDEAIPVMLSTPGNGRKLAALIGMKIVLGMVFGGLIDWLDRTRGKSGLREDHASICEHCGCEESGVLHAAVYHTVTVFFFILIVSLILNTVFWLIGEEAVSRLLLTDSIFQPLVTALFGFIPNCAASVILTQLYIRGSISFGSVLAGLASGTGIGIAVLFRMNRDMKENFRIVLLLYAVGAGCGMILQLLQ